MKIRDIILATLVALIWGGSYIAIKYTVMEIPGLLSIAIRYSFIALILIPFVPSPNRASFKDLYSNSLVVGVFCLGILYYGMSLGFDTNLTTIIMQLTAPIAIVIARFTFKEPFTLHSSLGIIIAFSGMLIVVGAPQFNNNYLAFFMVLCAAFFLAVYNIQSKKLKAIPPLSLVCWTNLIAAPHLFLMSYFFEGNPFELVQEVSYKVWVSLFYSVVISSCIGLGTWIYLLHKYPINKVIPFNLLVPFFGILLSGIILGEIPTWHIIIGALVTVAGIALSQMKSLPFLKNKEA